MNVDLLHEQNPSAEQTVCGKYLRFHLDEREFAIHVMGIQEVLRPIAATPLPGAPGYVRGVVNLRGKILPVIELRKRFGFPVLPDTDETCIIVLEQNPWLTGILVDKVLEISELFCEKPESLMELPGEGIRQVISSVAWCDDHPVWILNPEKLITENSGNENDG